MSMYLQWYVDKYTLVTIVVSVVLAVCVLVYYFTYVMSGSKEW